MGWLQMERVQLGQVKFLKFEEDKDYIISFRDPKSESISELERLKAFEKHVGFDLKIKTESNYNDITQFMLRNNKITEVVQSHYDGVLINSEGLCEPIELEKWIKKGDIYFGYIELDIEDYSCYGLV